MKKTAISSLYGALLLAACSPPQTGGDTVLDTQKPEYSHYIFHAADGAIEKHSYLVTQSNIYSSLNKEDKGIRYVLPERSFTGFHEKGKDERGSSLRPLDRQKTTFTFTPKPKGDDLKFSLEYKTIDLEGRIIPEQLAYVPYQYLKNGMVYPDLSETWVKWLSSNATFPKGAECYKVTERTTHQDYIEYSTTNKIGFKVDANGNAVGFKKIDFGNYVFYTKSTDALKTEDSTPVIIHIGNRYYHADFHPKKTDFLENNAIEAASAEVERSDGNGKLVAELGLLAIQNSCDFYNSIATQAIDTTLK